MSFFFATSFGITKNKALEYALSLAAQGLSNLISISSLRELEGRGELEEILSDKGGFNKAGINKILKAIRKSEKV